MCGIGLAAPYVFGHSLGDQPADNLIMPGLTLLAKIRFGLEGRIDF